MAKEKKESAIIVEPIRTQTIKLAVIGESPLILNRMSQKARQELLLPKGRKTAAEKQANLKHNPLEEFRASPYILKEGPVALAVMSSAFKGAMATAALDLPGTKKSQIGRLVYVESEYVGIYGIPKLFMSVTRTADVNRTPDIRTRAIVPEWAAVVTVTFVVPLLNETAIVNLMNAGGKTAGIGDWRPEKGKGAYGQYRVTTPDDPEFVRILNEGGREAQEAAMEDPECYDSETETMLEWFIEEVGRRGKAV